MCAPLVGPGKSRQAPSGVLVAVSRGWVMGPFLLLSGPGHHPPLIPGSVHCPEVDWLHWFLVEKLKLGMIDLTLQVLLLG